MPLKRKNRKINNLKNRNKKKPSLGLIIKILLFLIILTSLPVVYFLSTQEQDIRQQAAGCREEHVDTEFRMYKPGTDKGWDAGNEMKVKTTDKIDVNCFAKTGTALLSNAKISLKVDGVKTTIPASNVINQGASLKGYEITQGGIHAFTCSNNAGCSNTDKINIPKEESDVMGGLSATDQQEESEEQTDSATNQNFATGTNQRAGIDTDQKSVTNNTQKTGIDSSQKTTNNTCTNQSAADLNNDCLVDLKDYDLFLSEFIKLQNK